MLKDLTFSNFKSWKKASIQFGRITGIFGANSSGKSSLIQFLLLLKNTKNNPDRNLVFDFGDLGQLINLGTYKDIVYGHSAELPINWNLKWVTPEEVKISDPTGRQNTLLFSGKEFSQAAEVEFGRSGPVTKSIAYEFAGERFRLQPKSGDKGFELSPTKQHPTTNGFFFTRTQGRVWDLPKPLKTYLFPDQAKTYYQNADFLGVFEAQYESLMDTVFYLGPLRDYPKRVYSWSGGRPTDVGFRGEKIVDAILAATTEQEKRKIKLGQRARYLEFQGALAYWLKEIGLIESFRVVPVAEGANLYNAWITISKHSPEVLITDVGFGISQVLPAIVLLQYVPEGSTVIFEQPEIHLHPRVQSGLADVIINTALIRNLQVIIESHSEHFLRRLQRRIAEEVVPTEEVKLYFCNLEHQESTLDELSLDLFGNIENWPPNFFGDDFGEIFSMREAALKRQAEKQK